MQIYTKTGDKGETSLYDGTRIRKDHIRVESYGTIDELNSNLGLARTFIEDQEIIEIIYNLQKDLFNIAGELATAHNENFEYRVNEGHIQALENMIDHYIEKIPKTNKFIVPGTNKAAASLHVARTVCRRAERRILTLSQEEYVSDTLIKYINRLSDLIYVLARYLESDLIYVNFEE